MEQPSAQVRTAQARPARRRLTEAHPLITPSTRTEMNRAYNQNYVSNLRSSGTPTRRELAEAILQAVIESITSNPKLATIILRAASEILRSVETEKGQPVFNNNGIKRRIASIAESMPPVNP
jgi:hypothetical protein